MRASEQGACSSSGGDIVDWIQLLLQEGPASAGMEDAAGLRSQRQQAHRMATRNREEQTPLPPPALPSPPGFSSTESNKKPAGKAEMGCMRVPPPTARQHWKSGLKL